jgi:hypothetical protein
MSGREQIYDFMVREVMSRGGITFEVVDKVTGDTLTKEYHRAGNDPYYMIAAVFLISHIFIFICLKMGIITPDIVFFIEIGILILLTMIYRLLRKDSLVFETTRRRSIFEVMRFLRPRSEAEKEQYNTDWVD